MRLIGHAPDWPHVFLDVGAAQATPPRGHEDLGWAGLTWLGDLVDPNIVQSVNAYRPHAPSYLPQNFRHSAL